MFDSEEYVESAQSLTDRLFPERVDYRESWANSFEADVATQSEYEGCYSEGIA